MIYNCCYSLSPDTFAAVPKLSCVKYNAIIRLARPPSDGIPIIGKNGSALIIAPPGAPGAATIAIPNININGNTVENPWSIPFIISTATANDVTDIILPDKWIVAHKGTQNSLISLLTPLFLAHSTFTGIVAAEDRVPTAVKYPGIWFLTSLKDSYQLQILPL